MKELDIARRARGSHRVTFHAHSRGRYREVMTRIALALALSLLPAACGGSDSEPKSPSTTQHAAPDEKGEEDIQMSPGSPAAPAKKAAPPAEPKPASAPK